MEDLAPWDEGETWTDSNPRHPGFLNSGARFLIGFYRRHTATNSISRCPFAISCSRYAEEAIGHFGFVHGLLLFIDRHLYREHTYAWDLYPVVESPDGVLRLDDGFFLRGSNRSRYARDGLADFRKHSRGLQPTGSRP